jgi:hypothetical protein
VLVNGDPLEAIMVDFKYKFTQDLIEQTQIDVNERNPELFARDMNWAHMPTTWPCRVRPVPS